MNRALIPWVVPVALIVTVAVVAIGSVWLEGLELILVGWVLFPLAYRAMLRTGAEPPRWMSQARWPPQRRPLE